MMSGTAKPCILSAKPGPEVAEHEILNAHKYKKIKHFSGSYKPKMLFFLLINVKMPTIFGSLTFMSVKNFMLS